jgi:Dynamin family/Dynamin central region
MDQQRIRRRDVDSGPYGQYPQTYDNHSSYGTPTPPAMSSVLDGVPLGSDEENSKLLDLVDRLRECRVDQYIDLPQVVVVGDQSSGKSSVLEAITQIPFPRASIACTRHATQIRLRRDPALAQTVTKVSIIPYRAKDKARYDSFTHTVDEGSDFTDIFQRATELIFGERGGNFLSRDILSIERTGPSVQHMMTVVDLPGIIHNPTKTQTVHDVEAISDLSRFYMSKDRTIILPIVGCDSEYAKQIIIRRCKEADPAGMRTLGIITKPDMTLTAEREAEFLDLACNKDERNKLQLGWHVLRNRAHNEMNFTSNQRDEAEKNFFASTKWSTRLEPSQLGVEQLRKKLSTQLIRHIANEVFKVQGDIERQLNQCKDKLKGLGPGLDTVDKMRQELQNLCKRSGSLTREAVQGHGINPLGEDFFPRFNDKTKKFARNLRSRVVILNETFSDNLEKYGSAYLIEGSVAGQNADVTQARHASKSTRIPPKMSRKEFIEREVQPLIRDNPGQELSVDINPRLVYRLFQSYSENWPVLAEQHIDAVQKLCEEFLTEVMTYAWPQRLRSRAWRSFVQQSMEKRNADALHELDELKKDRYRNIRTYHSAFDSKYYQQRSTPATVGRDVTAPALNKFEDTLNKMLLHYEHQLPTFISNVITQVVERHLIDGMEEIFESTAHTLADAKVKNLMEEDSGTRAERKEIKDQRDVLEEGLEICREIARRPDLGPYEYRDPKLAGPDIDARLSRRAAPDFGASSAVSDPFTSSNRSSHSDNYPQPPQLHQPAFDEHSYYDTARHRDSGLAYGESVTAPLKTPTNAEEEDEDLKRALEESKREASQREHVPSLPSRPAPSTPGGGDDASSYRRSGGRNKIGGLFGR